MFEQAEEERPVTFKEKQRYWLQLRGIKGDGLQPEGAQWGGCLAWLKTKKKTVYEEDGRREGGGAGGGSEKCALIGSERILIDLEGSVCHILGIDWQ